MSIRFPSLIDAPRIGAPVKKEMRFTTTDWKFLKSRLLRGIQCTFILSEQRPTCQSTDVPLVVCVCGLHLNHTSSKTAVRLKCASFQTVEPT